MESNLPQLESNALSPSKPPARSTGTTPTETATTAAKHEQQQPYSSDPFAPNYRHICHWNEEEKAEWIATWPLPVRPDFWEVFESAEHAEHTRQFDQLRVLLRRVGLDEGFMSIMTGRDKKEEGEGGGKQAPTQLSEDDNEGLYERARKLLRDAGEGGELLERAEKIWQRGKVLDRVFSGEAGVELLLEVGDVAGYNWIKMSPELIGKSKKNVATGQQDAATATAKTETDKKQ